MLAGAVRPFAELQRRIGRKNLTPKILREQPVALLAYDLLEQAGQDLRALPQRGLEVSRLYHDRLYRRYPDAVIDLHLAAISSHLGLPALPAHDALSDAIIAALIFLRLTRGGPLAYPKV